MVGSTISHYKILGHIGSGGMGEVWEAEDLKLGRPVALKFLAAHLVSDPEVHKRFEREAKAAASLSHPNICTVYEIDEADGKSFLSMELIKGDSLEGRIEKGPLALTEALDIARQLAEGLQEAHGAGVVHRDIKPANILITPDGRVKILDFGLALLTEGSKLTQLDTAVGTVAYMSPEQAQGGEVDHRTDIWALGCVLYEMVCGQRPFKGQYDQALLYEIVNEEPEPLTGLRTSVPVELELLIGKCLEKESGNRYGGADELARDLRKLREKLDSGQSMAQPAARPGPSASREPAKTSRLLQFALMGCMIALAGLAYVHFSEQPPERVVRRFSFTPESLESGREGQRAAISPDGRWVVYTSDDSPPSLWLRPIDSEQPTKMEGTEGAQRGAFWSPDSQYIGFAARSTLKKVPVSGGPPIVLCEMPSSSYAGGSWDPVDDSIVYSVSAGGPPSLHEVPARGGQAKPFLKPISGPKGFGSHTPTFLPPQASSRALLLAVGTRGASDVYLRNLDTGTSSFLVAGAAPRFAAPGFIVYQQRRGAPGLWALPFSLSTLETTGEPLPIAQGVGDASFSSSRALVSVDVVGAARRRRLMWRDRTGARLGDIGRPHPDMEQPALAPDNRSVLVTAQDDLQTGAFHIWLHEADRPVAQRLVFDLGLSVFPCWSPDGKRFVYSGTSGGTANDLFIFNADGSGQPEKVVATPADEITPRWSPDGRWVLYTLKREGDNFDIWMLDLEANSGEGATREYVATEARDWAGDFSPDGGYFAYDSEESGTREIYVREFPSGAGRMQVSSNGGVQPRWHPSGKELFFVEGETLMAVEVTTEPEFRIGKPERLFSDPNLVASPSNYDVAADGRFVVIEEVIDESSDQPKPAIHITENWYEEFRDREQD